MASCCSRRYAARFAAARASSPNLLRSTEIRRRSGSSASSRTASPIARPSSSGRPGPSPCQNGILPGSPGAAETMTRSGVTSSIRHEEAPSTNTSPGRLSCTISSSSSPTRRPSTVKTP